MNEEGAPSDPAPIKVAAAPRAPKRIVATHNEEEMQDDMPDEEPDLAPRVVKRASVASRAPPASPTQRASTTRVSVADDEDDDPGSVFVSSSAATRAPPAAAPKRSFAAAAPATPVAAKKRVPLRQTAPAPPVEDDEPPPFDEEEAAAFAAEQRALEQPSAPPVVKRTTFASSGPKIIPSAPRASSVPSRAPAGPTPSQEAEPSPAAAAVATPRKRFVSGDSATRVERKPDSDATVAPPRAAPSAPALSTSGKFVAPATTAATEYKLPDQQKMQKYIAQLFGPLPDVLKYLVEQRGLTEDTLRLYRVGACVLRIKDSANSDTATDHPCVAFPWYERDPENPSGEMRVARIKTRSLKRKEMQRLDPVGGKWGMFGWHLVEEQLRQQGSQRAGVRSASCAHSKAVFLTSCPAAFGLQVCCLEANYHY